LLLLGRGLWHAVQHHELLLKTFLSSALFCTVGVLFGILGLKSKRRSGGKPRGRISKRHRRIPFFVLLVALLASSQGRSAHRDGTGSSSMDGPSSACPVPVQGRRPPSQQCSRVACNWGLHLTPTARPRVNEVGR
jgi:hypothetical protein